MTTPLRGLKAGALGGLVGAAALGLLTGLSAFLLDQEVFYVTIATKLGLASPAITGWILHFLVGLLAGGVSPRDHSSSEEIRSRHDSEEFLGRLACRDRDLDRSLCTCR